MDLGEYSLLGRCDLLEQHPLGGPRNYMNFRR
jgi:hypothetical protein